MTRDTHPIRLMMSPDHDTDEEFPPIMMATLSGHGTPQVLKPPHQRRHASTGSSVTTERTTSDTDGSDRDRDDTDDSSGYRSSSNSSISPVTQPAEEGDRLMVSNVMAEAMTRPMQQQQEFADNFDGDAAGVVSSLSAGGHGQDDWLAQMLDSGYFYWWIMVISLAYSKASHKFRHHVVHFPFTRAILRDERVSLFGFSTAGVCPFASSHFLSWRIMAHPTLHGSMIVLSRARGGKFPFCSVFGTAQHGSNQVVHLAMSRKWIKIGSRDELIRGATVLILHCTFVCLT